MHFQTITAHMRPVKKSNVVRQPPMTDLTPTEQRVLKNLDASGNHFGISADRIDAGVLLISTYHPLAERLTFLFVLADDVPVPCLGCAKDALPGRIADMLTVAGQPELAESVAKFPSVVGVLRDDPQYGPTPVAGAYL